MIFFVLIAIRLARQDIFEAKSDGVDTIDEEDDDDEGDLVADDPLPQVPVPVDIGDALGHFSNLN